MVGKDEVEALDESMIEDMGKGYRFRPFMQAVLIAIVIFVTAFTLYLLQIFDFSVPGNLAITTLTFTWILAFLFPLVVKTKSHRVHQISMGIYWAAILSLIGVILLLIIDQAGLGVTVENHSIALLIAFLSYIEPKDSAIIADIPSVLKQSTACCLELPAPKFLPTTTISPGFAFFEKFSYPSKLSKAYWPISLISVIDRYRL